MSAPNEWSINDKRFLRSLRIVADAPAPPSPRFVVEPGKRDGEFIVIDRLKKSKPRPFKDRASAADRARQLNEKHVGMN